jgi:hypothetical protein
MERESTIRQEIAADRGPDRRSSARSSSAETEATLENGGRLRQYARRLGWAGFLFFFLKGLILYVLIPLGLFKWIGGC